MKKTIIALFALAGVAAADSITLTMPGNDATLNVGRQWTTYEDALTVFGSYADGGYMFNGTGLVSPGDEDGEEGVLTTTNGVTSLLMAPRTGAAGSGEAIVLSGKSLYGDTVQGFDFSITSSSCTDTADIRITLAVITQENNGWNVVEQSGGAITLNSKNKTTVSLNLTNGLTWSDSYKVVAVIDNQQKNLAGGPTPTYTLSGISMTAQYTPAPSGSVPEPTTATLSLLALAGLAARRRRRR